MPPQTAISHYSNWGRCMGEGCVSHYTPRCLSFLCEKCCDKSHTYWLGHLRVNGQPNEVTLKAQAIAKANVLDIPAIPLPPPKPTAPPVPEPGKLTEVTDTDTVFVVAENNSYSWNKDKHIATGFPLIYIL
jgi:hypothetical protein